MPVVLETRVIRIYFTIHSTDWHNTTQHHTTQTNLLLLIPAAWVSLQLHWPLPPSHAPVSCGSESSYPPSLVSVVPSTSPRCWWLPPDHLQVEVSPITWTHIYFEMSALRQMRWEYSIVHCHNTGYIMLTFTLKRKSRSQYTINKLSPSHHVPLAVVSLAYIYDS